MKKIYVGSGVINVQGLPEIVIEVNDKFFVILPESMITPSRGVICSVYEYVDSNKQEKTVKEAVDTLKRMKPDQLFSLRNGRFRSKGKVAYQVFNTIGIFDEKKLTKSLSEIAGNMIKKSKAYYSKLEHLLLTIAYKESRKSASKEAKEASPLVEHSDSE